MQFNVELVFAPAQGRRTGAIIRTQVLPYPAIGYRLAIEQGYIPHYTPVDVFDTRFADGIHPGA